MRDFSDWIRCNDLVYLPLRGADFTESNMQKAPTMSQSFGSVSWDHCPLLLETDLEDWGPMPFRFELMWIF